MSVLQMNAKKAKRGWADPQYLTTDLVLFTIEEKQLKVLLMRRAHEPFKGFWALPGCFVLTEESLEQAAARLLLEKTGVRNGYLEQLFTFGDTRRGPELRVVTTAYYGVAPAQNFKANLNGQAEALQLFPIDALPDLGFDHAKIVSMAVERLRHKVNYTTISQPLLDEHFTLTDLQEVYEIILHQKLDKRNFRRKMQQLGILKNLHQIRHEPAGRPAGLFSFAKPGVTRLQERGILVPF